MERRPQKAKGRANRQRIEVVQILPFSYQQIATPRFCCTHVQTSPESFRLPAQRKISFIVQWKPNSMDARFPPHPLPQAVSFYFQKGPQSEGVHFQCETCLTQGCVEIVLQGPRSKFQFLQATFEKGHCPFQASLTS